MFIYCPEYIFWENGEIYSGFAVFVDDVGRIKKIISCEKLKKKEKLSLQYLKGLLIPGMVNSHCHLELSWMKMPATVFQGIENFFSLMKGIQRHRPNEMEVFDSIQKQIVSMYSSGIEVCADISNSAVSYLAKEHSKMKFHTFVEVFEKEGLNRNDIINKALDLAAMFADSEHNSSSLSLHTLFTSSLSLINDISKKIRDFDTIHSIHFLESKEEKIFFSENKPIQNIHEKLHVDFSYQSAVDAAIDLLPKENRVLFVHNTFASERDVIDLCNHFEDPWFCFCPISNHNITGTLPDIQSIKKHSENLVLGTDSLASNTSLNLFAEMDILLKQIKGLQFEELLKMATINGAKLLGVDNRYGSISPGKQPGLIQIKDYSPNRRDVLFNDIRRLF